MADKIKKISLKNFEEAIKKLEDVESVRAKSTSNNLDTIQEVLDALYQIIHAMFTGKLPNKVSNLMKEAMMTNEAFISKIQFAYVYYYARYIELSLYGANPKTFGAISSNNVEAEISNTLASIMEDDRYRLLDYIMCQNAANKDTYRFDSSVTKMAAHFPKSVFDLKKKILNRSQADAENLTADNFFEKYKSLPDQSYSVDRETIAKLIYSKDPVDAFIAEVVSYLMKTKNLLNLGMKFPKNDIEKENTELGIYYKRALEVDKINAEAIAAIVTKGDLESEEGLNNVFRDLRAAEIDYYKSKQNKGKANEKSQEKEDDKDAPKKEEATGSLQDQLALNMADYITGRISAEEFQKRDKQIRNSGKTDQPTQQLDEEEPGEA